MPVYSMTGYASTQHTPGGNAEIATPAACLALELRSVNRAGAVVPLLMGWTAKHIGLSDGGAELLRPLLPVAIGGGWPWLMPLLRDYVLSWVKKKTEG